MNECLEISGDPKVHAWEDDGDVTPRDRRCLCGEHSWGEMDDLLTLTEMWELS